MLFLILTSDDSVVIVVCKGPCWYDVTHPTHHALRGTCEEALITVRWDFLCVSCSNVPLYIAGASDPPSTLQESPTRFPPTQTKPKDEDSSAKGKDKKSNTGTNRKSKKRVSGVRSRLPETTGAWSCIHSATLRPWWSSYRWDHVAESVSGSSLFTWCF